MVPASMLYAGRIAHFSFETPSQLVAAEYVQGSSGVDEMGLV